MVIGAATGGIGAIPMIEKALTFRLFLWNTAPERSANLSQLVA
jgi:hypothetical protein